MVMDPWEHRRADSELDDLLFRELPAGESDYVSCRDDQRMAGFPFTEQQIRRIHCLWGQRT